MFDRKFNTLIACSKLHDFLKKQEKEATKINNLIEIYETNFKNYIGLRDIDEMKATYQELKTELENIKQKEIKYKKKI